MRPIARLNAAARVLAALTRGRRTWILGGPGSLRLESTMRFPIPHIAIAILLVHVAFGCCLHHGHSCIVSAGEQGQPQKASHCCCGSHRHLNAPDGDLGCHHSDGAPSQNDHQHPHFCDGTRCTFVRSEPSPEQRGEIRCDVCQLLPAPTATSFGHPIPRIFRGNRGPTPSAAPPLRAHLFLGVLLI